MSPTQIALLLLVAVCLLYNSQTEAQRYRHRGIGPGAPRPSIGREVFRRRFRREAGVQLEGEVAVPRSMIGQRMKRSLPIIKTVCITRPTPKVTRIQRA